MREKDVVAQIATALTILFKTMIFGAVLLLYGTLNIGWFWYILLIITGAVWVLGLQNVMLLYHIFRE